MHWLDARARGYSPGRAKRRKRGQLALSENQIAGGDHDQPLYDQHAPGIRTVASQIMVQAPASSGYLGGVWGLLLLRQMMIHREIFSETSNSSLHCPNDQGILYKSLLLKNYAVSYHRAFRAYSSSPFKFAMTWKEFSNPDRFLNARNRFALFRFLVFTVFLFVSGPGAAYASDALAEMASLEQRSLPAPPAPISAQESIEYYDVSGYCAKDLQKELRRKGVPWKDGKVYDSFTRWSIEWDYGYEWSPGSCSPEGVNVTVQVTVRYPRWIGTRDASSPLAAKWRTYRQNLELHENIHREMILEAAVDLSRTLETLPAASSCNALDRVAQTVSRGRIERLRRDSREYDRSTRHGLTQGAVLR